MYKLKKLIFIGVHLLFIYLGEVNAQKIILELSTGIGTANADIKYTGGYKTVQINDAFERQIYTLGIVGQINKYLFLKTEIGTNGTSNLFLFEYGTKNNSTGKANIFGKYQAEFIYFALLPEVRFDKDKVFYLNMGIGIYNNIVSKYTDLIIVKGELASLTEPSGRAFIMNFGMNPRFGNLGFIINIGFHNLAHSNEDVDVKPNLSFSQWNARLGVTYNLN